MEASRLRCRPPARAHHCRAAANPSGLCSCHRPASGAVCTQLRSVRAATDGSRWQLRSRGSAGEAPAEECKGTLGCPQQWASGTGLWCRLVTLWGAGLGTWWAGRCRSGCRAHEPRRPPGSVGRSVGAVPNSRTFIALLLDVCRTFVTCKLGRLIRRALLMRLTRATTVLFNFLALCMQSECS